MHSNVMLIKLLNELNVFSIEKFAKILNIMSLLPEHITTKNNFLCFVFIICKQNNTFLPLSKTNAEQLNAFMKYDSSYIIFE